MTIVCTVCKIHLLVKVDKLKGIATFTSTNSISCGGQLGFNFTANRIDHFKSLADYCNKEDGVSDDSATCNRGSKVDYCAPSFQQLQPIP
ncbi:MAG: hypothetical protein PUP93_19290 [Rhizonema sp. NSF051]|nr:hypothetical protein [Rhizonema sp. NSF051]